MRVFILFIALAYVATVTGVVSAIDHQNHLNTRQRVLEREDPVNPSASSSSGSLSSSKTSSSDEASAGDKQTKETTTDNSKKKDAVPSPTPGASSSGKSGGLKPPAPGVRIVETDEGMPTTLRNDTSPPKDAYETPYGSPTVDMNGRSMEEHKESLYPDPFYLGCFKGLGVIYAKEGDANALPEADHTMPVYFNASEPVLNPNEDDSASNSMLLQCMMQCRSRLYTRFMINNVTNSSDYQCMCSDGSLPETPQLEQECPVCPDDDFTYCGSSNTSAVYDIKMYGYFAPSEDNEAQPPTIWQKEEELLKQRQDNIANVYNELTKLSYIMEDTRQRVHETVSADSLPAAAKRVYSSMRDHKVMDAKQRVRTITKHLNQAQVDARYRNSHFTRPAEPPRLDAAEILKKYGVQPPAPSAAPSNEDASDVSDGSSVPRDAEAGVGDPEAQAKAVTEAVAKSDVKAGERLDSEEAEEDR